MKLNTAVETALATDSTLYAVPELVIDWNMNRYLAPTADNTPSDEDEGFDVEIFPIESIVEPLRPKKGINKARVGQSVIGDDYQINGVARNGRYYIADTDDPYKYWTSPYASNGSGVIANVKPQVIYSGSVDVNKIVITTENSWASAKTFSIQVTSNPAPADNTSVGNWTEIANQTSVGTGWKPSGQIVLHYNGSVWVTTGRVDNADGTPKTTAIRGVRIVVTALEGGYKITEDDTPVASDYKKENSSGQYITYTTTGNNSFFDLIEISARLEVDLSEYLISFDDDMDMSAASNLYPIGTVSTNQANITLSNLYENTEGDWIPGFFNYNNVDAPYSNLIDANAKVTMNLKYMDSTDAVIGRVQEFEMYTETWTGQSAEEVEVDLSDYSKFFDADDAKLPACLWEELTVSQIIGRLMDSIGFTNYKIDMDETIEIDHTIPVFYVDGDSTVWEVLDELAQATQTAIYFDSYGILRVKTRDLAFGDTNDAVAEFTSDDTVSQKANIISLEVDTAYEPNHYTVTYQKTDWSKERRMVAPLQSVWEPETDAVILRATPLKRALGLDDINIFIGADDVRFWPYEGMVNIEGELIRFEGKVFRYYANAGDEDGTTIVIKDEDDFRKRNKSTPIDQRHRNGFTGALRIAERGVWNSEAKAHTIDVTGYTIHQLDGTFKTGVSGFHQDKQHSRVQLISGFTAASGIKLATRGSTGDTPFYNYGTRMRFLRQAGRTTQRAGLVIHNATNDEDGYFIELTPSSKITGKSHRKEVMVYSRSAGKQKVLDNAGSTIAENIDYEVDVTWAKDDVANTHTINVWVNGKLVSTSVVSGADRITSNGKFGLFVRGSTRAEFEYLYALKREEESPLAEDFSFLDKVQTGYTGGQWDREWVFRWKDAKRRVEKKSGKERIRFNRMYFDEFGPIVHEIRHFKAKFDPSPVLHSRLFLTNDWSAVCLKYRADPFGAEFVLANTTRNNSVIHGEDNISFTGTGEAINQTLGVLGRVLVTDEESEKVVAKNEAQIRRRGKVTSELTSKWIQNKAMAKRISDWMNEKFSYGNDNISLEVFGNPLIEIGDVVSVVYPDRHIDGDFFVLSVKNEFTDGLTTNLTLRRRT